MSLDINNTDAVYAVIIFVLIPNLFDGFLYECAKVQYYQAFNAGTKFFAAGLLGSKCFVKIHDKYRSYPYMM